MKWPNRILVRCFFFTLLVALCCLLSCATKRGSTVTQFDTLHVARLFTQVGTCTSTLSLWDTIAWFTVHPGGDTMQGKAVRHTTGTQAAVSRVKAADSISTSARSVDKATQYKRNSVAPFASVGDDGSSSSTPVRAIFFSIVCIFVLLAVLALLIRRGVGVKI